MDTVDTYVRPLIDAVTEALPAWLERCVVQTSVRVTGGCTAELRAAAAAMALECSPGITEQLERLLATDVDRQQSNPLSVLRAAVRHPTRVLATAAIPPVRRDAFSVTSFPDDVYDLSPATWADIDESVCGPGLMWGAWKAKTVMDRRRYRERPPPPVSK